MPRASNSSGGSFITSMVKPSVGDQPPSDEEGDPSRLGCSLVEIVLPFSDTLAWIKRDEAQVANEYELCICFSSVPLLW